MSIVSPDIVFFNTCDILLKQIRQDWNNHTDKSQTLLGKMLIGTNIGKYQLFEQAQTVFLQPDDNPRKLDVRMGFDTQRADIPTLHITLPREQPAEDGIGIDEGFGDTFYNDDDKEYTKTFTRRFSTNYSVMITSDNRNEVVLVYNVFRALLISAFDHMQLSGLENIKLSGGDLQINDRLAQNNIFMRSINVNFSYDLTVPDFFDNAMVQQLNFTGTALDPFDGAFKVDTDESVS